MGEQLVDFGLLELLEVLLCLLNQSLSQAILGLIMVYYCFQVSLTRIYQRNLHGHFLWRKLVLFGWGFIIAACSSSGKNDCSSFSFTVVAKSDQSNFIFLLLHLRVRNCYLSFYLSQFLILLVNRLVVGFNLLNFILKGLFDFFVCVVRDLGLVNVLERLLSEQLGNCVKHYLYHIWTQNKVLLNIKHEGEAKVSKVLGLFDCSGQRDAVVGNVYHIFDWLVDADAANSSRPSTFIVEEKVLQELFEAFNGENKVLILRACENVIEHACERDYKLSDETTDKYNAIAACSSLFDVVHLKLGGVFFEGA
jgi:hypothetical protein